MAPAESSMLPLRTSAQPFRLLVVISNRELNVQDIQVAAIGDHCLTVIQ